jgi:hypothetical protein
MTDIVQAARDRLIQLEREAAILRDFIARSESVAKLLGSEKALHGPGVPYTALNGKVTYVDPSPVMPQNLNRAPRGNFPPNPKTSVVIPAAIQILKDAQHPMTRRELHSALEMRGLTIYGVDPIKALGTILWRARDQIIYVDDKGYWPVGEPLDAR